MVLRGLASFPASVQNLKHQLLLLANTKLSTYLHKCNAVHAYPLITAPVTPELDLVQIPHAIASATTKLVGVVEYFVGPFTIEEWQVKSETPVIVCMATIAGCIQCDRLP